MSEERGLTWAEYEARRVNAMVHGSPIHTVEECALRAFEKGNVATRAEIIHTVWLLTGIMKSEVEAHISGVLTSMESQGKLRHQGHNEWRLGE